MLFYRFIIQGNSMEPSFRANEKVVARRQKEYSKGDVVVLRDPRDGRILLKRISQNVQSRYFIEGENQRYSTDSRHFDLVENNAILGKVIFKY